MNFEGIEANNQLHFATLAYSQFAKSSIYKQIDVFSERWQLQCLLMFSIGKETLTR